MEEEQPHLQPIDFPISDVAEEMAQSFAGPAKSQGKDFVSDIQPMLAFTGDEKAMRQLVSILLDNALTYSPPDGHISLSLEKQGRSLLLTVGELYYQVQHFRKIKRSSYRTLVE